MNVKRFILILAVFLVMFALTGMFDVIAQKLDSARSNDGKQSRNEYTAVVEQFWAEAENGRLERARSLRTDTNDGFKIVIENDNNPWERVIHETGMKYVKTLQEKCVSERECRVLSLVKNTRGKETRLFHTLTKANGVWRILYITY